jgi:hypothetical protein
MNSKSEKTDIFVTGQIIISSGVPQFSGGVAHIRLVDTTYQDAVGVSVSEMTISDIQHQGRDTILNFRLEISELDRIESKNDYSVQVWIDVSGNGKPQAKDLFTRQNYPVLTHGFENTTVIKFDEH